MATTKDAYIAMKKHRAGLEHTLMHLPPTEKQYQKFAENAWARRVNKHILLDLTSGTSVNVTDGIVHEVTLDSSGTWVQGAGGLLFNIGSPSDNDDMIVTGIRSYTVTAGKWLTAVARLKSSSAANLGWAFGVQTYNATPVLPLATDATDGIYLIQQDGAATCLGRVTENGSTTADTATLSTQSDDTFVEVGFRVKYGAAGVADGVWIVNGTETPFTAAQKALIVLQTAAAITTQVGAISWRINGTTTRTGTLDYAIIEVDK